jgi:hypothetical protein
LRLKQPQPTGPHPCRTSWERGLGRRVHPGGYTQSAPAWRTALGLPSAAFLQESIWYPKASRASSLGGGSAQSGGQPLLEAAGIEPAARSQDFREHRRLEAPARCGWKYLILLVFSPGGEDLSPARPDGPQIFCIIFLHVGSFNSRGPAGPHEANSGRADHPLMLHRGNSSLFVAEAASSELAPPGQYPPQPVSDKRWSKHEQVDLPNHCRRRTAFGSCAGWPCRALRDR